MKLGRRDGPVDRVQARKQGKHESADEQLTFSARIPMETAAVDALDCAGER